MWPSNYNYLEQYRCIITCARNIIVHGLQESSSNDPTVRIASDIKLLDDNIHPCKLNFTSRS